MLEMERDLAALLRNIEDAPPPHLMRGDQADLAVASEIYEAFCTARDRKWQRARDLQAAIDRYRAGTFGLCLYCGDPIAPARLRIIPEAVRCLPCQEESEKEAMRWQ